MGIFDKKTPGKRKDDFDSPVETVDLGQAAPPAAAPPAAAAAAPPSAPAASNAAAPAAAQRPAAAAAPAPAPQRQLQIPRDEPDYGIEKAIELMRTLPQGNVELVVQVVKFTLESAQIKIGGIIEDATARQDRIQSRISVLRTEIADLEQEIRMRAEEIGKLEADYSETSTVKERLQLAEQLTRNEAGPRAQRGTGPQVPSTAAAPASGGASTKATGASAAVPNPPVVAASAPGPAAGAGSGPGNVKK